METELDRLFFEFRELGASAGDSAAGKPPQLAGYAAVFGSLSQDLGGFREIIAPGAFRDALTGGADIRALCDHDPTKLMGRTTAGTLRIAEDDHGLRVECDAPDTSYARDMMALVKRGDVKGMSFGFTVPKGGDAWGKSGGALVRTLNKVSLGEVSFVGSPAYTATSCAVRCLPATIEFARSFIEFPEILSRRRQLRAMLLSAAAS